MMIIVGVVVGVVVLLAIVVAVVFVMIRMHRRNNVAPTSSIVALNPSGFTRCLDYNI